MEEMRDNMEWSLDAPTCQLFTGHVGSGKSTELLRLKHLLEEAGFHVVYFECDDVLEMSDVDVTDILSVVALQVGESLKDAEPRTGGLFGSLFSDIARILNTEVDAGFTLKIPGVGDLSADAGKGVSVSSAFGALTVKTKDSPDLRRRLRQHLEPRTNDLIRAINEELLEPATANLKKQGKKGLAVIVDNLDRVDNVAKSSGRLQPEYLFVDRGEQLNGLLCHMVYTIPLKLLFSDDYSRMTERFHMEPYMLPMAPVNQRNGEMDAEGRRLLARMLMLRALPDLEDDEQAAYITDLFENEATLDRLITASGGHVRTLLRFACRCVQKQRSLPVLRDTVEAVILERRNRLTQPISDNEWELLRKARKNRKVSDEQGYRQLLHSMFVFEYWDAQGSWFDVNPVIAEAEELN